MSEQRNPQAIEFVMEQIEKSGQSKVEIQHVLGALSLWRAAHGDFDLPKTEPTLKGVDSQSIETDSLEFLPVTTRSTEMAHIVFDDAAQREAPTMSVEALSNAVALKEAFIAILAPYVLATNAKVQHAEIVNGRKRTGEYTWHTTQLLNNKLTNVFFTVPYESFQTHNEATGLEVAYTRRDKPHKRDLRIKLDFKNGGVDTLTIKDFEHSPSNFGYHAQNILPELLASLPSNDIHLAKQGKHWNTGVLTEATNSCNFTHTFHLQDTIPSVVSTGWSRTIIHRFNAEKNVFYSTYKRHDEELPTVSEYPIEPKLMVSFVEGLLATLPKQKIA